MSTSHVRPLIEKDKPDVQTQNINTDQFAAVRFALSGSVAPILSPAVIGTPFEKLKIDAAYNASPKLAELAGNEREAPVISLAEVRARREPKHPSIAFLQAIAPNASWHLTAIGVPPQTKRDSGIRACTFDGENREVRAIEWIERHNALGANVYFSPNPLKRRNLIKASKADVVSANWLWAESDPPKKNPIVLGPDGKPMDIDGPELAAWRKGHIASLAAMPEGVPAPTLL
jgi:hypothetical protein